MTFILFEFILGKLLGCIKLLQPW